MILEHRTGTEFRVQGRTLSGRALVYGDIAPQFAERFSRRVHSGRTCRRRFSISNTIPAR